MPTVNGAPLLTAELTWPRIGAWRADVEVDTEEPLEGSVEIDLGGGVFAGTVVRSGTIGGRTSARVVGGAGGLSREIAGRNYAAGGAKVSVVLADILRGTGEALAPTADTTITSRDLPHWHREGAAKRPASHELVALLDAVGATWRLTRAGQVWVGVDTYPDTNPEHVLLDEDWSAGILTLAVEAAELEPGTTFLGHQLEQVVYRLTRNALRAEAHLTSLRSSIASFLGGIRRAINYSRLHPARVAAQNADGTLQLVPDDANMRASGIDKVPIRHGLPGIKVKVPSGARVRLGFDDGDPSKPFAAVWDTGAVTEVQFDGGTQPIARNGDLVQVGGTGTVVTFAPVTPAGGPMLPGTPYLVSFSPIAPTPVLAAPLFGAIMTGIAKFLG